MSGGGSLVFTMMQRIGPGILFLLFAPVMLFSLSTVNLDTAFRARPSWIEPLEVDTSARISDKDLSGGFFYFLMDQQVHAELAESYFHYSYTVVNQQGVQQNSELRLYFSPEYQNFFITGIRVFRNGSWLDYQKKVKLEELREETGSDSFLYDGYKTILIILSDIRPGDVIDYEYVIKGKNPVFGDRHYSATSTGLSYPMLAFRYRVLANKQRNLTWKIRNASWEVEKRPVGSLMEYRIDQKNVPKVDPLTKTPPWYYTYPSIECSEWQDWKAVAQWGTELFEGVGAGGLPDSIWSDLGLAENLSAEEKILGSIRFVQNEIRYLGIEMGVNSHKPRSPAEVLDQRFGDCKDKSLLLAMLARKAGWKAWPALVDTVMGPGGQIGINLPNPQTFNHCIVLLEAPDKTRFFLDPTASHEGGTLETIGRVNYGDSLILDGQSSSLFGVKEKKSGQTKLDEVFYTLKEDGPSSLKIVTVYSGEDADRFRYTLSANSLASMQEGYLEFYRQKWPGITVSKDMDTHDDLDANTLTVFESYSIPDLWKYKGNETDSKVEVAFYPYLLDSAVSAYGAEDKARKHPLAIEHPQNLVHTSTIILPDAREIGAHDWEVNNSAFKFSNKASNDIGLLVDGYDTKDRRVLKLSYQYRTWADLVAPEKADAILQDYQTIQDQWLGYAFQVERSDPLAASDGTNLQSTLEQVFLLVFFVLGASVIFALGFRAGKAAERRNRNEN